MKSGEIRYIATAKENREGLQQMTGNDEIWEAFFFFYDARFCGVSRSMDDIASSIGYSSRRMN